MLGHKKLILITFNVKNLTLPCNIDYGIFYISANVDQNNIITGKKGVHHLNVFGFILFVPKRSDQQIYSFFEISLGQFMYSQL